MSWTRAYRLALHLLPDGLRRKHGQAMEALFAREVGHARARGPLHGALAGTAGLWDLVRRGAYERVRPARRAAHERPERPERHEHASPPPTTRQLLRRHAASFAVAFATLTTALLALFAARQLPGLAARGATAGTGAELLLLAVPFTAAMSSPMAVFVAVLHEFTRLQGDGTLAAARGAPGGIRRLLVPVLAAGVAVGAATLASNTAILPHANHRLAAVLAGRPATARSDREMTVGELRAAAHDARAGAGPRAQAMAAVYEVEVQKKFALAAACAVLALAGAAVALRVPRGRAGLVIGASGAVFVAYYALMVTGEELAERLLVSPVAAVWAANVVLLVAALLALAMPRAPGTAGGRRTVALHG